MSDDDRGGSTGSTSPVHLGAPDDLGPAWYRFDIASQRLWWSPAMYRLHGYAPGAVTPSLDLVYRHKHPKDEIRARQLVHRAVTTGAPFTFEHRIIDAHDVEVTTLAAVKVERWTTDNRPAILSGVSVDLSGMSRVHHAAGSATPDGLLHEVATLTEGLESRTIIGRATGILMARLDVDSEVAFELLRTRSQHFNVKLRRIAQLVNETGRLPVELMPQPVPLRSSRPAVTNPANPAPSTPARRPPSGPSLAAG